ncbi:GDSL-like lipase/acylhydrolase [Medicago truncatula]|uniref:GDSL-like lipase/acylhydrolase n=1 Tax=Medicago truncatula TaxID=3880 RepID=G7IKB3_MEDTR|nr:GDSL-like lipase/acylhydrolase [Medicago truncatula]
MKFNIILILISFIFCFHEKVISNPTPRPFNAIFNFGNSLSDTGNFLATGANLFTVIGQPPYGETFFRHATGRCSDGRLVIDFIAVAYELPYLQPYLKVIKSHQIIRKGVNFAVAGATALDVEFFNEGVRKLLWLKPSLCTTKQDCDSYFKRPLFVVGEIGGNDYNYAAFAGDITHLRDTVPLVVQTIAKVIDELIAEGAVELLVPGNLPVGCSVVYLTSFSSKNIKDYDENGCLKSFNDLAKNHNMQLNIALQTLRKKNPHARIMYADYFGAAKRFFHSPRHYGFTNGALNACCGGGRRYNFNDSARCGYKGSKVCEDPSTYTNWDGIHLTEAAYRHIAKGLINGPFSIPPLKPAFFKIA